MKSAVSTLTLCGLLLIGCSPPPRNQSAAQPSRPTDPLLVTSEIVAQLHGFVNTDEWHRAFTQRFADGSTYDRKQIELIADIFQTKGVIARIQVWDSVADPEQIRVEVKFKNFNGPTVSNGEQFPLSAVVCL